MNFLQNFLISQQALFQHPFQQKNYFQQPDFVQPPHREPQLMPSSPNGVQETQFE